MTDSSIQLAGASALAGLPEVQLETKLQLTEEQRARALGAKAAYISAGLMTAEWIRLMRDLRDSLTREADGNNGWSQICLDDFGCDSNHANRMIKGWEALFSEDFGSRTPGPQKVKEINPTHYAEIGDHPPAVRMQLAALVRDGQLRLTQKSLRDKAKEIKAAAKRPNLKVVPQPKPAQLSTAPLPKPKAPLAGRGKTYSYSKYRDLPEGAAELKYLLKKLPTVIEAGNVFAKGLNDILKRYQNKAEDDRHLPDYMTMWAQAWREDEKLDYIDQLNQLAVHISSIRRAYELTIEFTVSEGLNLEP